MGIHKTTNEGYLCLLLHAHLPFVRNPEHEHFLEERWLFEAMTETYLPLIDLFRRLEEDGIDFRMTMSVTPPLIEMFKDRLLMERYRRYLSALIELSEHECHRTRRQADFSKLARLYRDHYRRVRSLFEDILDGDVMAEFRSLNASGRLEIIASAATHAYLPSLMADPASVKAQISIGAWHYRETFGSQARGMWLPECGYMPGIDGFVRDTGVDFICLESHGLLNSSPQHGHAVFAPLLTPSGLFAFSRDADSSRQVWSASDGYPGDPSYRDFYRDIGFDLDWDYLSPYLPEGVRTFTGLKYYRITGREGDKKPYAPEKALARARSHAAHFLASRAKRMKRLKERLKIKPLILAAYDAELLGHWWHEGPAWLEAILRRRCPPVRVVTLSEYLYAAGRDKCFTEGEPAMSSWGAGGYGSTWINDSGGWICRHLIRAGRLMTEMSVRHPNARGRLRRALNQALRELLLAQSSDWTFMMKSGNAAGFGKQKAKEHLKNFFSLQKQIMSGCIEEAPLIRLELKNNIFGRLDYRIFAQDKDV